MESNIDDRSCGDCGAQEGMLHAPGCDMERCPFCGGQLMSCECPYEKLNIDITPGTWAYEHGLTDEQEKQWDKMLTEKGRIPHTENPIICARCGKLWPDFFMTPQWNKYVPPNLQDKVLCRSCYDEIRKLYPKGWRKPARYQVKKKNTSRRRQLVLLGGTR
jgi:hypothetical protein